MMQGMAEKRLIPRSFAYKSRRGSPAVAIAFNSALLVALQCAGLTRRSSGERAR